MKNIKFVKNLIFDIDGTLWDCTDESAAAFSELLIGDPILMKHYPITSARLKAEFGKPAKAIGRSLFPELTPEDSLDLITRMCFNINDYLDRHPVAPYVGVEAVLRELSKTHGLYVVSNGHFGYPEVFYRNTGLGYLFNDYMCHGQTGLMKADNIRKMVDKYHLEDVAYIGDTAGDEAAAREAGVVFIHAAYGYGQATAPDAVINNPGDLVTLLC